MSQACVAPVSCLTSVTNEMVLEGFRKLESVAPLCALSRLQFLDMSLSRTVSLQPLAQLPSLTTLKLYGGTVDLQPLSALSRTLHVLAVHAHLPQSRLSIGAQGMTLRSLCLMMGPWDQRPSWDQLGPRFSLLSRLTSLGISCATTSDLSAIGQQLQRLQVLRLSTEPPAESLLRVTSLAALTLVTRLSSLHLLSC
jgi:Leucine-rich repeat (LRR) protein